MLLQKDGLKYMSAAAHEGKLVVIATDDSGHLWYTVKQDGFEDSYLGADPAKRTGWEAWVSVDLPDEADDTSVVAREQETLTRKAPPGTPLLRSVYRSRDLGAPAPVQLVSGEGHLYVFRQSKAATLLCDRFVLDGMTNKLGRKLEVRFKRSRKRLAPYDAGKQGALAADSLDFRDTAGNPFYEPTTELCLVDEVTNGWFAVVRVHTGEHEKFRWHVFSVDGKAAKVKVVSFRTSEEGLFDLRDDTVFDKAPRDGDPPIPRSFVISASFVNSEMGVWEKRETTPAGLVLDGMVTAYEKTADGKLRVSARSHGLSNGDTVQIVGTASAAGTFPVTRIDDATFVIERKWAAGEAVNVRVEALKRRGLVLDGRDDYVDLPPEAFPAGKELTVCLWARGGSSLPKDATILEALDKDGKRVALIAVPSAAGEVSFDCGNGAEGYDHAGKVARSDEYKGEWAHWAFTKNAVTGAMAIYRNGVLWRSGTGSRAIGEAKRLRLGAQIGSSPVNHYEGNARRPRDLRLGADGGGDPQSHARRLDGPGARADGLLAARGAWSRRSAASGRTSARSASSTRRRSGSSTTSITSTSSTRS